jgi:hypothetical protein
MDRNRENALLARALAAIGRLGLQGMPLPQDQGMGGRQADARLHLGYGGTETEYAVEIKRHLTPATLGAALHQLARHQGHRLLVTEHVTPPLAEQLRELGVEFIDAAGNAYLNQPPLLVWVKGQRPPELPGAPTAQGRAFQNTGLQVLFLLLCRPEAMARPYREIAELAGVAHGTVGWVMPELTKLGYMVEIKKQRRLVNGERLLKQWVDAYLQRMRPKLLLGRYAARLVDWTERGIEKYGVQWGGEPAAFHITHFMNPGAATLYGDHVPTQLLIDWKLRPDPEGNVEILKRFWNFDDARPGLVPDILVYADLLATGDARCLEAAQDMYGGLIDRFK